MRIRGGLWLVALATTGLGGAAASMAGCGKDEPVEEVSLDDAGSLPRRPARVDSGSTTEPEPEPKPEPEPDSGIIVDEDSGLPEAGDPGCENKPNGAPVDGVGEPSRCCAGQIVDLSTTDNCGGCGIKCPSGFACAQAVAGKWGCRCATNDSCVTAGYGTGATCYDTGGGKFCNCQCAVDNSTCDNRCGGGATCNDKPGQNYCHYPIDGG